MAKSGAAKTVKRALKILNFLATEGGPVGVIELSKEFKANQSTVYRILSALVKACTPNTLTAPDLLRQDLERTRVRGYAVDHEEFMEGICCVAVHIRGNNGRIEGALSVSGSTFQVQPDAEERLAARLQDVSYEVSGRLGYIA